MSDLVLILEERRRQIDADINQLMTRRAEVDFLIIRAQGEEVELLPETKVPRRKNVKKTVMELIAVAGNSGVTSSEVVDNSRVIGRNLDRVSVSSLLSKLKREKVVSFDGEGYYQYLEGRS